MSRAIFLGQTLDLRPRQQRGQHLSKTNTLVSGHGRPPDRLKLHNSNLIRGHGPMQRLILGQSPRYPNTDADRRTVQRLSARPHPRQDRIIHQPSRDERRQPTTAQLLTTPGKAHRKPPYRSRRHSLSGVAGRPVYGWRCDEKMINTISCTCPDWRCWPAWVTLSLRLPPADPALARHGRTQSDPRFSGSPASASALAARFIVERAVSLHGGPEAIRDRLDQGVGLPQGRTHCGSRGSRWRQMSCRLRHSSSSRAGGAGIAPSAARRRRLSVGGWLESR